MFNLNLLVTLVYSLHVVHLCSVNCFTVVQVWAEDRRQDLNPHVDLTFDPSSCSFAQLMSLQTAEEQKFIRSLPISHRDAQTIKSLQCYCEAT